MSHTLTWEQDGLYRVFTGKVTGEEILKSNFELHVHPNFQDIKYIINDFTGMTDCLIEVAHTNAYAKSDDIISNTKGRLKIALVAVQEDHIEIANNYRKQMDGKLFECEIFKTVEEARKWVSI